MASWQTPITHVTGDTFSVSDYNVLASNEVFLYQRPYANVYCNASASVSSGGMQVPLAGTTAIGYGFSLSSSNLLVPLSGTYVVGGQVEIFQDTPTYLIGWIEQNGTIVGISNVITPNTVVSAAPIAQITNLVLSCTSSDTLSLWVETSSDTDTIVNSRQGTFLSAFYLGET